MTLPGQTNNSGSIQNEEQIFGTLFYRLYPILVKIAVSYTFDMSVAEDIVQESFLRLWNNRNKLKHHGNLENYLMTIVKNNSLNWLKHKKIAAKYILNYLDDAGEADYAEREMFIAALLGIFARLPEKRREIMKLNIFEGKSYVEIAGIMDISLNTVKDHIKKAYLFMRKEAYGKDL